MIGTWLRAHLNTALRTACSVRAMINQWWLLNQRYENFFTLNFRRDTIVCRGIYFYCLRTLHTLCCLLELQMNKVLIKDRKISPVFFTCLYCFWIYCVPKWNTKPHREKMTELLFEKFNVPAMYMVKSPVVSRYFVCASKFYFYSLLHCIHYTWNGLAARLFTEYNKCKLQLTEWIKKIKHHAHTHVNIYACFCACVSLAEIINCKFLLMVHISVVLLRKK